MIRRLATIAIAAVALTLAVPATAEAHNFGAQGPPHSHEYCTMIYNGNSTCNRWILANGAIIQGPNWLLNQQYGYVLVLCSIAGDGNWHVKQTSFGPWGNTGNHPYCKSPTYNGVRWSLRP